MFEEREHGTVPLPETLSLMEAVGIARVRLTWLDSIVKSFLAGVCVGLSLRQPAVHEH